MSLPSERAPVRALWPTHVFPRQPDDPQGAFLLHLAAALSPYASIDVIAPHAPGLPDFETFGSVRVHRFHYAPAAWERLAYTGEMHRRVAASWANKCIFLLFNLALLFKTLALARAGQIRLIHAHWWLPSGLVGALASFLTACPLLITMHGTDVEQMAAARGAAPLARWVLGRAAALTCGSTYLRDRLAAAGVLGRVPVRVLPMPINPLFLAPLPSAPARPPGAPFAILAVTRLSIQKSLDTLIAALALLRASGHNAHLTLIGEGEQRAALEAQARDLGLTAHISFRGSLPQSALPSAYAACDVSVLPSLREGTGLVLAEALLCGAPVVAAAPGGVTDIITDGETGLLVPPRDPPALAAALESLILDPALRARLAAAGRARVLERFSPASVASEFARLYRELAHA